MTKFADAVNEALETVRLAGKRVTVAQFSREAGVPYTTVASFKKREWGHQQLVVLQRLETAARRINRRLKAADNSDRRG